MPLPSSRRVSFSEKNDYSRLPHDDEMYVLKAFTRHANKCRDCRDPYQVYHEGGSLCSKGNQRALDVAQYVYNKSGQAYSVVDSEKQQRVQIEIPSDCEPVRSLLKAMERGLRVFKRSAPSSYDKTYYVPARRNSERILPSMQRRPSSANLRPETIEPPRSSRPRHSHSRSYNSALAPSKPSSRSPSPSLRPGLSRYGSYSINPSSNNASASRSRNSSYPSNSQSFSTRRSSRGQNGYSSASSRDNSPFSSRNNSISSQSSWGSFSGPSGSAPKPSQLQPLSIQRRPSESNNNNNSGGVIRYYSTRADRDRDSYERDPVPASADPRGSRGYYSNRGRSRGSYDRDSYDYDSRPQKSLALYNGRRESSNERDNALRGYESEREPATRRPSPDGKYYKAPVIYRIKREPSPQGNVGVVSAKSVAAQQQQQQQQPKDEYVYSRRR